MACGTTLGAVLTDDTPHLPDGFPESAQFSDEFVQRAIAAARTYKRREIAQSHIPQAPRAVTLSTQQSVSEC
jgi:hypothetical protein